MATPEHVRAASQKKRERVCKICGEIFIVRSADRIGLTCSKPCLSKRIAADGKGRKQSQRTKDKRSATLKKIRSDPVRNTEWAASAADGVRKWHQNPDNARIASQRSSDRMKSLHSDPEFQKRRDERSSQTMKATWLTNREAFTAMAIDRYANGIGLNSKEANSRRDCAWKWILTKAQEALRAETEFNEIFADIQERIRRENPFIETGNEADYFSYLKWLGSEVTKSAELHAISDPFMSEAIPRFARAWKEIRAKREGR